MFTVTTILFEVDILSVSFPIILIVMLAIPLPGPATQLHSLAVESEF